MPSQMHATLPSVSLKPFTQALRCQSKFSEDLVISAEDSKMCLIAMNQPKTSYCRTTFYRSFFEGVYRVGNRLPDFQNGKDREQEVDNTESDDIVELPFLRMQISVKTLMAAVRSSSGEQGVEWCRLSYVEGVEPSKQTSVDESSETRLVVKLNCKHGVNKTYKLSVAEPSTSGAPALPNKPMSQVTIGAATVRELLEYFNATKASDPKLKKDLAIILQFKWDIVTISARDTYHGRSRVAESLGISRRDDSEDDGLNYCLRTSLTLDANGFEAYELQAAPITLSFFLREFNATILLAESLSLPIMLRFTASCEPLFITIESPSLRYEAFCALATQEVPEDEGDAVQTQDNRGRKALIPERSKFVTVPKGVKRERGIDEDPEHTQNAKRRRGVTASDVPSSRNTESQLERNFNEVEMDIARGELSSTSTSVQEGHRVRRQPQGATRQEPLFFPASQMTQADIEAFKAAGLGDAEDLEALLDDGDTPEADLNGPGDIIVDNHPGGGEGVWEDITRGGGDGTLMEATQILLKDDDKAFIPLFDD